MCISIEFRRQYYQGCSNNISTSHNLQSICKLKLCLWGPACCFLQRLLWEVEILVHIIIAHFECWKENINIVAVQKINIYWNHSHKRLIFSLDLFRNKLLVFLLLEHNIGNGKMWAKSLVFRFLGLAVYISCGKGFFFCI